ncbi:MAG: YidC/Oxa1 family membrane protein insertase [Clostridiales bacterium]|nr:YidC/Oxa1 family membrane protein insertase [Clostridiales bacterium]
MGYMISFLAALEVPDLNWVGNIVAALYNFVGNYGWTVVLFTVILKVITLPLDFWQRVSTKKNAIKMQQMQPMMEKIDKAYGANVKGAQQEKQKLMKKFGYSMFSSCLPTLVTLVVFIIMFSGLTSYSSHANVKEYNELVEAYHYNVVIQAQEEDLVISDTLKAVIADGVYEKGDWNEQAESAYFAEIVPQINALVNTDQAKYSRIIEGTKVPVAEFAKQNRESFLWIKNIWRADTWQSVMPDYDEFKNGGMGTAGIDGADEAEYNVIYDAVTTHAGGYAGGAWNGLLILPALAIALSFLSMKLTQGSNPMANDPQSQKTSKMMMLMMPLLMSFFILLYTAALGVYIVSNSILSIFTTLLITPIVNKMIKEKDVQIVKQASYRR